MTVFSIHKKVNINKICETAEKLGSGMKESDSPHAHPPIKAQNPHCPLVRSRVLDGGINVNHTDLFNVDVIPLDTE